MTFVLTALATAAAELAIADPGRLSVVSLAIAAGFGLGGAESYPGVFGDFGGFADDAKLEGGYLTLSDRPGIGFEGQSALYRMMREMVEL